MELVCRFCQGILKFEREEITEDFFPIQIWKCITCGKYNVISYNSDSPEVISLIEKYEKQLNEEE